VSCQSLALHRSDGVRLVFGKLFIDNLADQLQVLLHVDKPQEIIRNPILKDS
jgi:hypothetical protein